MATVIDDDVRKTAVQFGVDAALLQAVVIAEGNILAAVRKSVKTCRDRQQALEILARSCAHAQADFIRANYRKPFIDFWGAKWAPLNAENDPTHLNQHWSGNVLNLWEAK